MAYGLTTPAATGPVWSLVTDQACYGVAPQTAFDPMIEALLGRDKSLTLRWAAINAGGRSAVVDVEFGCSLYRLAYAAPGHGPRDLAGLTRITHLNGDVVVGRSRCAALRRGWADDASGVAGVALMIRVARHQDVSRLVEMGRAFLAETAFADFTEIDDDSFSRTLTGMIDATMRH